MRRFERCIVFCYMRKSETLIVVGEDAQNTIGWDGTRDRGTAHVTLHFPIGKVGCVDHDCFNASHNNTDGLN